MSEERRMDMPRKCPYCGGTLSLSADLFFVGDNTGNDDIGVYCGKCDCIEGGTNDGNVKFDTGRE